MATGGSLARPSWLDGLLSWPSWAAGVPVVLPSGFNHPTNEFTTLNQMVNWHACEGCQNDARHRFDQRNFRWCPHHAGTPRQFECIWLTSAAQVIATLIRIFGLVERAATRALPPMQAT